MKQTTSIRPAYSQVAICEVETVEGDGIFRMPTKGTETMVRIWSNRSWLPDKVIIGVD